MQDGTETSQGPMADQAPGLHEPPPLVPPRRRRSAKTVVFIALIAFFLGGGITGWLVWRGDLDAVLPLAEAQQAVAPRAATAIEPVAPTSTGGPSAPPNETHLGGVETRLALLEERFSRIDQQASAASANASRAEALLIALATRRMIDRGEPLGYLEYQLKLRFGGAQPEAVRTIVAASKQPVTLYLLSSQLEAAAPALSGERRNESTWTKVRRELSSLFIVRRSASPAARRVDRAERAQVLLKAGRVEDAIAEVERLPGADEARDWIAAARRYDQAQHALEIIETAAMLEPRTLRDGEGVAVSQASPIAPPADKVAATD